MNYKVVKKAACKTMRHSQNNIGMEFDDLDDEVERAARDELRYRQEASGEARRAGRIDSISQRSTK